MKNLFLKTLYQKRMMALFWLIGLAAMTALTLSVYNSFADSNLAESFKTLPKGLQKSLGDVSSFKTIGGFISQQIYELRIPLLSIILSIALLVNITAGDEQKGLLETQLTLPVGRLKLLLQKLTAALLIIAFASLGAVVGIEICLPLIHQHYGLLPIFQHALNAYVLAVDYGLVAFALGAATGRRGLALGLGSAFAFISYLIDSLAPSVSYLQSFDKLTLFHFYSTTTFDVKHIVLLSSAGLLMIVIGSVFFVRRDIRSS